MLATYLRAALMLGAISALFPTTSDDVRAECLPSVKCLPAPVPHESVKWTVLKGLIICFSKTEAVEMADMLHRARTDWRIVDAIRQNVGAGPFAFGKCGVAPLLKLHFDSLDIVHKALDGDHAVALVLHENKADPADLEEAVDRQVQAMANGDAEQSDPHFIIADPELMQWVFQPGTRVN